MKLSIFMTKECASEYCADKIAEVIQKKPSACLGLATGTTFIDTYKLLITKYKNKQLSFLNVKSFNLDEYINCAGKEKWSYRYFMQEQLFNHININVKNTHFPNSIEPNTMNLKAYDKLIQNIGIDIQILGVGRNGHIAFNEPTNNTQFTTHIVNLTETTIKDNAFLFFNNDLNKVPRQAVSMGIDNILSAKKILVAAFGESKADAIAKFCSSDKVDSQLPISYLNKHDDVELVLDKEAAKNINLDNLSKKIEVQWL